MHRGWMIGILVGFVQAGCSTFREGSTVPSAEPPKATGQVAPLRAIGGSAVSGKIRVIDRGDGATVLVSAINIPVGDFRIAFHQDGNCSSPNGFSAGPAWAPASTGKRPQALMPLQRVNSENRVESESHVTGLHATGANGVAGRSVMVYAGPNVAEVRPDVPNAAIACGVFEQAQPLAF